MPNKSSSDSSSDSEDEATKRMLREATDTTLLTNSMFNEPPATDEKTTEQQAVAKPLIPVAPQIPTSSAAGGRKSQRYIDLDERPENDMQVTESMQNFMHKKLNQIIEKQIEFVDDAVVVDGEAKADEEEDDSAFTLQLFSGAEPIVLSKKAVAKVCEEVAPLTAAQKKPKAHKRKRIADDTAELSEAQKITESVVDPDALASEVSAWADRAKPDRLYRYKEHASKTNYLIEPTTEFTAQRKKNNWSENKIARPKVKK